MLAVCGVSFGLEYSIEVNGSDDTKFIIGDNSERTLRLFVQEDQAIYCSVVKMKTGDICSQHNIFCAAAPEDDTRMVLTCRYCGFKYHYKCIESSEQCGCKELQELKKKYKTYLIS